MTDSKLTVERDGIKQIRLECSTGDGQRLVVYKTSLGDKVQIDAIDDKDNVILLASADDLLAFGNALIELAQQVKG